MYTSLDIAQYVLQKCTADKHPIANLQLQRILYLIQREFLERGRPAFVEDFEAWNFGPVIPSVYYRYCGFGANRIWLQAEINLDPLFRNIIDPLTVNARDLPPWTLNADINAEGGPWYTVFDEGRGDHRIIPKNMIARSFLSPKLNL